MYLGDEVLDNNHGVIVICDSGSQPRFFIFIYFFFFEFILVLFSFFFLFFSFIFFFFFFFRHVVMDHNQNGAYVIYSET